MLVVGLVWRYYAFHMLWNIVDSMKFQDVIGVMKQRPKQ